MLELVEARPRMTDPTVQPAGQRGLRVLVASHGHPQIAKGGAEIAAYRLYQELSAAPGCQTWFLGCQKDRIDLPSPISQPFSEREFVYTPATFDWFTFANRDQRFPAEFERLLEELAPDIVHFHHYGNFGVEAFHIVRRAAPRAKIVLTLHEYLAICAHYGQMITRPHRHLCYRASTSDCAKCFPEHEQSAFYVREAYIKRFMGEVDHFIAPSQFLRGRYAEWGLPEDKISVIENVIDAGMPQQGERSGADTGLFRIGFFGQISYLKGINVLLEAARLLNPKKSRDVSIEIHGAYTHQPAEMQTEFLAELERASRNVRYAGPYEQGQVDRLMRGVDAVVVPSIWWENSPVVIQEAFRNRRPVICSDIGGMAEKVRDGIDGLHFPVGDALALARLIERLAAEPEKLRVMREGMQTPPAPADTARQHLALYQRLLSSGPTAIA
jgi:glycosyltransferase involved in cell wall biosynthesis